MGNHSWNEIRISVEEAPLANKLECYLNSNHMKYLGSSFIIYIMLLYGLHVHAYVNILTK